MLREERGEEWIKAEEERRGVEEEGRREEEEHIHLKDYALEDGEGCSCSGMQGKDDIVELDWVHSSRVPVKILVLGECVYGHVCACVMI